MNININGLNTRQFYKYVFISTCKSALFIEEIALQSQSTRVCNLSTSPS